MKDFIFIAKEMAYGVINLAPYAAIAIVPAIYTTNKVIKSIKNEQKNRPRSVAADQDPNRYIA